MNITNKAAIFAAFGGPGSGKSHYLKLQLAARRPDRLIIIDPDDEYGQHAERIDSVTRLYQASCATSYRLRLVSHYARVSAVRQFDAICQIVRWQSSPGAGQKRPPKVGPLTFVVDELADFVGASYRESPDSWQWIIRRGRKYGVTLLAASQRPAQIDKTLFDLASLIRSGRLNYADSQRTVADALGVPVAEIAALQGHAYIERDKNTGKLTRGK